MIAPEAPTTSGGAPRPEKADPKKPNIAKRIGIAAVSVGVGTGIIIGAVVGLNATASKHEAPAGNVPVPTGEANPTATPKAIETNSPNDTEAVATPISAEKYTTVDAVARAYVGETTAWINSGATEANSIAWLNATSSGDFMNTLLTKDNAAFESQLLDSNEQGPDPLQSYKTNVETTHKATVTLNFLTIPNDPGNDNNALNKEAYKREQIVDSVETVSQDSTKMVANVTVHESDNSNKNAALLLTNGVAINTTPYVMHMAWTNVDGNWKLSKQSQ